MKPSCSRTISRHHQQQQNHSTDWNEISDEKSSRRAYLFGKIIYKDVFGASHRTEFCWFLSPASIERAPNGDIKTFTWANTEGRDILT